MPDCHKCRHDGRGSRACLTCHGPAETNHRGRVHVWFDERYAAAADRDLARVGRDPDRAKRRRETAEYYAREVLRGVAGLPREMQAVVYARIASPRKSLASLARALRMTRQAVHDEWTQAVERVDYLEAAIPMLHLLLSDRSG